jgi:sugar/nucleoside kinase (ribokinase family)
MNRRSIVCAGYMPLDIVRTTAGTVARRAGGTAANVAAILAYLGWDATLAGQAGDDLGGDELVADLSNAGVEVGQITRAPQAQTPRLVHDIRHDGHFYRYGCEVCGARFPRSRPLTLDGAKACLEARPSPTVFLFDRANAGTLMLAEQYAKAGSIVMFEPSVPANAELLGRAATAAHIIKHSDDRSVGGLDDLHVRPRQGQVRIVTHGAEGLELRLGTGRGRRFPALATLAVDTGGAGDWTTAGLLDGCVRNKEIARDALDKALRCGQALAAVNCAIVGARGLMGLTNSSARRRAHRVLSEGGLTSAPRVAQMPPPTSYDGACPSCLLPTVDQLTLDSVTSAVAQ